MPVKFTGTDWVGVRFVAWGRIENRVFSLSRPAAANSVFGHRILKSSTHCPAGRPATLTLTLTMRWFAAPALNCSARAELQRQR